MKICEYCGTKVEDNALQCHNCGSKDFENICINCGKTFTGGKCPACGVLVGEKPRNCHNCGKKTFEKVCPGCGADLIHEKQNIYTYTNIEINTNTKFNTDTEIDANTKNDNDFDISSYQNTYKPKKKLGCGFISLVFTVMIILSFSFLDSSTKNNDQTLSDLEILTLKYHPKLYTNFKAAKKFWVDYKKVAVDKTSSEINYEDKLLLVTTRDDKVITDIIINFSHSDEIKHELTVKKVLKVVCEYIPYDILEKYYTFTESFHETSKDGKYEAYHYVMSLNEQGKSANVSGDYLLYDKFAFKIIHRDDDWIAEINRSAYEGNHEKFSADAYVVEDWKVDLSKYK